MNVKTERTNDAKAVVTVEVDEERVQSAMRAAAQRVSRHRPIPGFRPGKAPYEMIERVVGKELLRDEAIEQVAQTVYKQVLKDEKIDPYDVGHLDVTQKEPLILQFTVSTRPVVTLGDYRSIFIQPKPVNIPNEEMDTLIDQLRREHAQLAPVERAVQVGDVVTVDVKGGVEGKPPLDKQGLALTVAKNNTVFPWLEQLVGANAGETREIAYAYPEGAVADLAGKTATYTVTIGEIKEQQLPAADDELAKMVGEYETLEQLKNNLRTSLKQQKEIEEENRYADEVIDAIVEKSQIVYPEAMLNDQIDQDLERQKKFATQLGMTWDKYTQLLGKDEVALRAELKPNAEKKIKRLLTILELIKTENITATREEVNAEIDREVRRAVAAGEKENQARRQLNNAETRRDIELNLQMRTVVDRVTAMAKGEPTSGKILTPAMLIEEQRARERAAAQATAAAPTPAGLITDPAQVRAQDWPQGLQKPLVPGRDK